MKKRVLFLSFMLVVVVLFSSCKSLDVSINTVGKNNTTAKKIAAQIEEDLTADKKENDYVLYGVDMSMDSEGIGKAQLFYTNKLPQDLKYSDITVVTVDTRTGKIDSVNDANFATMDVAPYEYVVNGAPLLLSEWKKDSEDARTVAENTFYGEENFVYNYVKISAAVVDELRQYEVTFISFVNRLQYTCHVDGMTGNVISSEITQL